MGDHTTLTCLIARGPFSLLCGRGIQPAGLGGSGRGQ